MFCKSATFGDFTDKHGLCNLSVLHSRLCVRDVVSFQQAVGCVTLERSLQRMSEQLCHAVVQLNGGSTQGDLEVITHAFRVQVTEGSVVVLENQASK